ncbi:hypothetical protein RJ639_029103, partial [Escallonia herrerae]
MEKTMEKNRNDDEHNWCRYNPIPLLNLVVSEPYYLFHFIAFFAYLPIRCSASQVLSPNFTSHLLHREIQAVLAFCMLTAVKMVKEESWEGFIADTLFFAKVFLVAVALVMDYHLALWFMAIFLVIYILTGQPAYKGLGTSVQLTPLQLETLLTEGNNGSRFWLVEFRALSSPTCIRTSRFFPELSITFSNKNLSFAIVDLGLFPNTAEKFGIHGGSKQLPTYILFENAEEVTRFPELDFESKAYKPSLSKVCS